MKGAPEVYGPRHLSAYRKALGRHPSRRALRRQLFLNFKGGTGKTSMSVAYAYRLAELGHRVLLIDLDSQGHATQHLGFEGDKCERTLRSEERRVGKEWRCRRERRRAIQRDRVRRCSRRR